jgi:glycosyltransferase involved in cell wall biosynthesis
MSVDSRKIDNRQERPLVSIITPFYNTERYLAECIQSVLAQSYTNFEYVLMNNQSTDSSRAIAERFAKNDPRIRLLDTATFVGQVQNFEGALRCMSPESRYCKMVLADDWLFPECVEQMVTLAEANPTVGIVSAYRLFGDRVSGEGLPVWSTVVSGREAARRIIVDNLYITGSPTSILVRADLVRSAQPFYPEGWIQEDTEACFRILAEHDLGFIHQVLTFSRKDDESTLGEIIRLGPGPLRRFMFAKVYGPRFLSDREAQQHLGRVTDFYGQFLAKSLFQFKGKDFWDFQRRGLRVAGADFWSIGLLRYVFLELLDIIFNPKKTLGRLAALVKDRQDAKRQRTAR